MPIFGRSFPSRSHPFGVISAPAFNGVIETIDNTATASFTLLSAEAQAISQSSSATTRLGVDATADTDSNSASGSNTLADYPLDVLQTSGSSTTALTAEATKESPQQSASGTQTLTAEATSDTESNSATGSQTLTAEKTSDTESNSATATTRLGVDATSETESNSGGKNDYPTTVVNDSPVSFWRFNDLTAVTAKDRMGNNDGSYTGAVSLHNSGPVTGDTSIILDGTDHVEVPDSATLDVGDNLSVEIWFKTTDTGRAGNYLMNKGSSSALHSFSTYLAQAASYGVRVDRDAAVKLADTTVTGLNDGQWHHFVFTKNGSNFHEYIDGIDRTGTYTNATLDNTNEKLGIGAYFKDGALTSTQFRWIGNLADASIYNYALTSTQVAAHYAAGPGNQTIATYDAETTQNTGTGSNTFGVDATSETISNSATNSQTIDESIVVPSVADTLDNQGTASFVLTEKHSESDGSSGSGTQALTAEATAESLTNTATAITRLGIDATVDTESNSATATTRLSETESDSQTNTGTGSSTSSEAIAETDSNSATGSQDLLENIQLPGDVLDNTSTSTQTISEAVAESPQNSATSDQLLTERQPETEDNTATGTQNIYEVLAEAVSNIGTASQSITDQVPETNMTSTGMAVHTLSEQIAETLSTSETSSQTMAQAIADTDSNSGTGTPAIDSYEGDVVNNSGTGSHITSDATAEAEVIAFLASQYIDDVVTTRVVPFSDITTGTWTVAPLYEKVDEIFALSGYPTESIRSGNNPVNDAAVLGLTPTSDPGTDENFYLNVQFWRDGVDGQLDFTLKLKEGSNVIATRTFTNVTETESAPRVERIAITPLEASAIVDFANLNVELIANEV